MGDIDDATKQIIHNIYATKDAVAEQKNITEYIRTYIEDVRNKWEYVLQPRVPIEQVTKGWDTKKIIKEAKKVEDAISTEKPKEIIESVDSFDLPWGYKTNKGQTKTLNALNEFFSEPLWEGKDNVFVLAWRWWTGKTTVVGAALESLPRWTRVDYVWPTNISVWVLKSSVEAFDGNNVNGHCFC